MSTEFQANATGNVTSLTNLVFPPTPIGQPDQVDLVLQKSLVRYAWNPSNDINLVGAEGLIHRLGRGRNFYGAGLPGETLQQYMARKGAYLLRCQVYPLWNINYLDSIYNVGPVPQIDEASGNPMGRPAPPIEQTKYAGVCARDMVESYGESLGFRELTPLTGMDGDEQATAAELVRLVQPFPYKLENLSRPFGSNNADEETLRFDLADDGPAFERIKGARLDKMLGPKAEQLRRVMLGGVLQALKTAKNDWAELAREFNRTKLGAHGKTSSSIYDENLAFLLGQPVPTTVQRPPESDGDVKAAINLLTQHALRSTSTEDVDVSELLENQKQMRGEIQALKMRLGKQVKENAE